MSIAGRSLGHPLGGLLADTVGWRWYVRDSLLVLGIPGTELSARSFTGQMPIAMICCLLTAWGPSSNTKKLEPPVSPNASRIRDLDFLGAGLFMITITSFLLVFNLGGQRLPWAHPIVVSLAVGCGFGGIAFVWTEAFWAKQPFIPLALMRTNGVGLFCFVQILLMCGRFTVSTRPDHLRFDYSSYE